MCVGVSRAEEEEEDEDLVVYVSSMVGIKGHGKAPYGKRWRIKTEACLMSTGHQSAISRSARSGLARDKLRIRLLFFLLRNPQR